MSSALATLTVQRYDGLALQERSDQVVVEEPLEILLNGQPWQATLRTPGADEALVTGLLFAEGVIRSGADILSITPAPQPEMLGHAVDVHLAPETPGPASGAIREGVMASACGWCGRTLIDLLSTQLQPLAVTGSFPLALLHTLPDQLRSQQVLFDATGGIHAAGIFTWDGELLALAEDAGRHNAVDKVIGLLLHAGLTALPETILQISGRAGYEILQKAWRAGIPAVAAVGAPTSLAVALADRAGITLAGFQRGNRGNLYTHPQRIRTV